MHTQLYRQPEDKEYTLLAYAKAKQDGASDLAKRIRWANESLVKDFNLVDAQLDLAKCFDESISRNSAEGWDT